MVEKIEKEKNEKKYTNIYSIGPIFLLRRLKGSISVMNERHLELNLLVD